MFMKDDNDDEGYCNDKIGFNGIDKIIQPDHFNLYLHDLKELFLHMLETIIINSIIQHCISCSDQYYY